MKAKIKKTGEIVNVASYATITLEQCDSWGNPIEIKPEEIELIQEKMENEHWQEVRERAAIAALQGTITILSNSDRTAFREIVVDGFRGNKKPILMKLQNLLVLVLMHLLKNLKRI